MSVVESKTTVGSRLEVTGQAGKVPCKLEIEFTTKSAHTNLNFITSDVRNQVVSSFPPVHFSHDYGTLDFSEIQLHELSLHLIERCDISSVVLTLNGVQVVSSMKFQPFC